MMNTLIFKNIANKVWNDIYNNDTLIYNDFESYWNNFINQLKQNNMDFFKVINLEQSEEQVLLVKNQDKDNNKFSVELFINVKGETHTAKFSFENESDRDDAFDNYGIEQASGFLEFMHNSIIK